MPISALTAPVTAPSSQDHHCRHIAFHRFLRRAIGRRADRGARQRYLLQKEGIGIRLADARKTDQVDMLLHRMYRQRGYFIPSASPGSDPSGFGRVTLEACQEHRTVGTLTVGVDSDNGLNAEQLYSEEIGEFRRKGARVCELTRLALDAEDCGKLALACLFHVGFVFAYRIQQATDLFVEVNPRHVLFYRRKLGFSVVGGEKLCPRVNAPAVLLHRNLKLLSEQVVRYGGLQNSHDNSFFSLWLTPWQENALVGTINRMARASN